MRDGFLIDRHGKQYVLYAGLLDAAHERGLSSIETEIIQAPTAENGQVAIVHATVEMANMDDEAVTQRQFSGIGDASPANVSKQMVPHILRMAETRAKARALRDAVNIGVTALEEVSDEDSSASEAADELPASDDSPSPNTIGDRGATQLYKHMLKHGWSSEEVGEYEYSHKRLSDHTEEEGRNLWKAIKAGLKV